MYTLFLALRYLRAHRIVYWSIAAVAVGILSVLVVSSVMGGFARDIRMRIRGLSSDITIQKQAGLWITDVDEIERRLRALPHVTSTAPRIEAIAWLKNGSRRPYTILGIDLAREQTSSRLAEFLRAGGKEKDDFLRDDGEEQLQTGGIFGSEMGGSRGTRLSFMTVLDPGTPALYTLDIEVAGNFKSGMAEYDSSHILVPLKEAQRWLRVDAPSRVNRLIVTLDDYAANGASARAAIIDALHAYKPCRHPERHAEGICGAWQAQTWEESRSILLQAVSVEKSLQFIILFLVVIVAGFNITSIYTLMVKAKTRDIGVVMALGGSEKGTGRVFLLCGLLCGIVGAGIGVVGGLGIVFNINEIEAFVRVWSRELHPKGHPAWTPAVSGLLALACLGAWWWRLDDRWRRSKAWWGHAAAWFAGGAGFFAFAWARDFRRFDPEPAIAGNAAIIAAAAGAAAILVATFGRWLSDRLTGTLTGGFVFLVSMLLGIAVTIWVVVVTAIAIIPWTIEVFPRGIYYLDRIPVDVDPLRVVVIVAGTLLTCLLFSLYPASRASKYDPVVAIRDE